MTIKDILEKTTQHFKQKGFVSARRDAEVLFGYVLNMKRVELYLHYEKPLSDVELNKCRDAVKRRSTGEPVAYICGTRDFYNATFAVGPGVLIPRPETEQLVELAAEWIQTHKHESRVRILDMGTGSGCIALSLAQEFPEATVVAVEASLEAVKYFELNRAELNLTERVELLVGDVQELSLEASSYDIICANPPYISNTDTEVEAHVRQFEPPEALFAENNGLKAIETWSAIASHALKPGGVCIFEIGFNQGATALKIFSEGNKFSECKLIKDYSNKDRFVFSKK